MEKLKLCEICGKEVVRGRDKHLNILNRYYHDDCLNKENVIIKDVAPDFLQDQIAKMTLEEKLASFSSNVIFAI